jgi:polyphenol oxidase
MTDEALARAVTGSATGIVEVKQVHGASVVEAAEAKDREGDALLARAARPPPAVGIRVADCVPVLIGDAASGDVAAIHAGWRGVVAGVVRAAVDALGGQSPIAAIGPCIGPCCFEVGRDVADRIALATPGVNVVDREQGDKAYVDLRSAVRAQLRAAGLSDLRIEDVPGCTKHEPLRFHSFRRDGASSGRMLAAIAAAPLATTARGPYPRAHTR